MSPPASCPLELDPDLGNATDQFDQLRKYSSSGFLFRCKLNKFWLFADL